MAIVNRGFARHFFGDKSPLGRHAGFGRGPNSPLDIEIIGVVEDTLYEGPREGCTGRSLAEVSEPVSGIGGLYVKTSLESKTLFAALRNEVKKLDAAMPVYEMKRSESQLDETLGTERLIAALSTAFGALATLLAAMGLYGVMAFVVARRTNEIGVRMALGAQSGAVVWMVMKEVLVLLAVGLAVGIPAAYLLSRHVSSQLFGVHPGDPITATIAVVVLALVALSAGFVPARRTSAIDPIQALRYE